MSIVRKIQEQVNDLRIFQNIQNEKGETKSFFIYVSDAFQDIRKLDLPPISLIASHIQKKLTKLDEITKDLKKQIDNITADDKDTKAKLTELKNKLETLTKKLQNALKNPSTNTTSVNSGNDGLDDLDDDLDDLNELSRSEDVLYRASNKPPELDSLSILPYDHIANLSYLMQVEDEGIAKIVEKINIQLQQVSMVIGQDIGVLLTIINYLDELKSDKTDTFKKALKQMDPKFDPNKKDGIPIGEVYDTARRQIQTLEASAADSPEEQADSPEEQTRAAASPIDTTGGITDGAADPIPTIPTRQTRSQTRKKKSARAESIVYDLLRYA